MSHDIQAPACPRIEDISALIDGELTGRAADQLQAHIAQCSLCAPVLSRFTGIGRQLQTLRETRCDVDLAAIVLPQLPPRAPAPARRPRRGWGGLWQLAPGALAAGGALVAGAYLGLVLVAGGGTALRPAAMTVFDAVPPGAVCAGLPACSPARR